MLGLEQLSEWWDGVLIHADPRVDGLLLMDSVLWPIGIILIYLIIVGWGPSFMKNRASMELRSIMVVYNFSMVALSGYIFLAFYFYGWRYYSLGCQPVDYSTSLRALQMLTICHIFFLSKFVELLDTIFFILRNKSSQMNFLHVFHHGSVPLTIWLGVKFVPGGFSTFYAIINSFVHSIMYFYYGVAALGPKYKTYLWWKPYVTATQIIQFIVIIAHASQLFFIECDYPKFWRHLMVVECSIFLVLFLRFWCRQLEQKKSTKTKSIRKTK